MPLVPTTVADAATAYSAPLRTAVRSLPVAPEKNAGSSRSLWGEWTDADTEFVERKFAIHELGPVPQLQKFVCGKQLYNYDNLEPSERKLVL